MYAILQKKIKSHWQICASEGQRKSSRFVQNEITMGAVKLDKEITQYLGQLNLQQKEVVLSVVKTFAREEVAWWNDKSYITEMERRFGELETSKAKGYTLEEMEVGARQAYKNRKHKK
jgi:hypothetical protein